MSVSKNLQKLDVPSRELQSDSANETGQAGLVVTRLVRMRAHSVAAVLLLVAVPWSIACADDSCRERPQDEIWLVSARQVGCLQSGDRPALAAQRYDSEAGWQDTDVAELLQPASTDQILVMYIHGNRVASTQAACEGRYVYRLLTSNINDPVSVRYVIWSWPSAQIRGQLHDVRVKAQRTELGGYCLGWFLSQLPQQQRVSILGYSFGTRIATGALHLLGGGQLSGRALPSCERAAPHVRIVMLAAAMHRNWLRPGSYHELAFSHLDFMLNLYNCCDPILKRYRFLYRGSRPEALGFTGMSTHGLGEERHLIEQLNVCGSVPKSHAAIHYFRSSHIKKRMQRILFWYPLHDDQPAIAAATLEKR